MDGAAAAWRRASAWPSSVQLGGRASEHHLAARSVRDALTGPPLTRLTLREKVRALRFAATTAARIGGLQASAVVWAVNSGGLWVGHVRPNLRPPGVERRHIKSDWEPMPSDHAGGLLLVDRARTAWRSQEAAAAAMEEAIAPHIGRREADDIDLIDNRITAGRWEVVTTASRTKKPEDQVCSLPSRPGPVLAR